MVDKISVQIALEGGDEVEKQLAAIGKAGDKAFAGLNESGSTAAEGITKAGDASQTTAEQTDKLAESTSKLSLEMVKTSAEIAAATAKFALHGVEIVQAVRHHNTLLQSLLKLVTGFNTATRVVAAFTPELALVGVTVGSTAAAVLAGVVAFEALEKVITKIAASDEKLNNTLQTLAATSGKSFDELQRGEATFKQIGISAETFRGSIAKIQETLAGTDVTNLTKGMSDIVALVKQIAAGDKSITFANWVTAEDKIKGVAIAMKQAADSGKDASQVLLEFIRNADLATAIKVGAAFQLSEADVDRVRRLNENVSDLVARIKGAGPLISPEAAAAFDRMRTSVQNVDSAWERLKQSLGTTFFTSIGASFSATMNDMKAAALNATAFIVERFNQAGQGMLAGMGQDLNTLKQFLQQIGATDLFGGLQNAAASANAAIANFVGGLMRGFGASEAAIKAAQDRINGVEQAANTAGQAVQKAGVMWTSYGTMAQQGANTASAAVQQNSVIFTQWGTVATAEAQKVKTALEELKPSLSDQVWEQFKTAGVAAWDAIIAKVREFLRLAPKAGGGAPAASGGGQFARGGMISGRGSGTSDSNLAWVSRGEHIMPARVVRQPGVLSLLEALRRGGGIPGFAAGGMIGGGSIRDIWERVFADWSRAMQGVADQLGAEVQQAVQLTEEEFTEFSRAMQGFAASGGLLGGRGTGTSDSNLAWVSRGEYITPARAVAQPGVLAFLEALRRSGGNLRSVLDGMGRFALGGMVPRMAFAGGGAVGSMSHVTIAFPGLPEIGGLRASSDVVDQLQRAAALAQVRSGGRKPSRYS